MKSMAFTAAQLLELLSYSRETGELSWRVDRNNRTKAGSRAGFRNPCSGYRTVKIGNASCQEHRVAWCMETGAWPVEQIDHINGIRDDNRWENLREATCAENSQNRGLRKDNRSGLTGVSPHYSRWQARIVVSGKSAHLGTFDTPQAAHAAYLVAKRGNHGFSPQPRAIDKARFPVTSCSQCGGEFGPGDAGFSHCSDHATGSAK